MDHTTNRPEAATDCDVLVIGGGLVGLTASMFLAQQGVRVTVVERHASTSIHPKARNLSIRTMELFCEAGIDEAVRAAGDNRGDVGIGDTLAGDYDRVFPTFDPPGQSPVNRAFCEQTRLEPIVRRRGEQLGATMLFGYAAVRITQNADSVTVDIARPDGTGVAPVAARYVIVADGANGTFRDALGIGRHGEPLPGTGVSIQFDADLDALLADRSISAFFSPTRESILFLRGPGRDCHVLALPPLAHLDELDFKSSDAQAISLINSVLGVDDVDITVLDTATWHTGAYVADRYRAGRVVLVGDAAHINPPHGGYGANTGIADAHNLAWKLAAVCRADADDALLDTYESERLPIAEYTVTEILAMAKASGSLGEGLAGPVNVTLGFRYPAPGAHGYDWRMPLQDPTDATGQPGTRIPHIALTGAITGTLDLVDRCGFILLAPEISCYATALRSEPIPGITLRVVADDQVADVERWQKIFPSPETAGLLIRPDGVIAAQFTTASVNPPHAVQLARTQALHRMVLHRRTVGQYVTERDSETKTR